MYILLSYYQLGIFYRLFMKGDKDGGVDVVPIDGRFDRCCGSQIPRSYTNYIPSFL